MLNLLSRPIVQYRLVALLLLAVAGQFALAAPPQVQLPDGPILPTTQHPNMMLDLSVEFPTVGPAYPRTPYLGSRTYFGNFDPARCYTYKGTASYKDGKYDPAGDDGRYFVSAAIATGDHKCSNQFSGNFMNWATSSAIDILRLSLSGGDRVIDEPARTVLQRAYLPTIFYSNGSNFPALTVSAATGITPRDVTPFSNSTVYVISCKNRVLFSTTLPVTRGFGTHNIDGDGALCDAQANSEKNLGEYVVRVSVCSPDEAPGRPELCTRYGTNFKPEGSIQKNADRMHFAAMGYLFDGDSKRYGGVLRAPMGYVGPNRFDAALHKLPNPDTEWDPVTGQLKYTNKGVIAYLNRFGSTGAYKSLDPVGELFYESIRYLQGKQPTPGAISNITDTMRDGFPAYTSWDDPIQASCQKTSIILIADANTHYDYYIPGNTRSVRQTFGTPDIVDVPRPVDRTSTPALDVMSWTHNIGVMETSTHGVDSTTRPALANLETKDTGGAINGVDLEGSYYLAGAAHWANVSELRNDRMKGINAQTYVIDVDEYGSGVLDDSNTRLWTHPRDSQLYLAAKYGAYTPEKDTVSSGIHSTPSGRCLLRQRPSRSMDAIHICGIRTGNARRGTIFLREMVCGFPRRSRGSSRSRMCAAKRLPWLERVASR
jgi:type IV pilus assembly protein PilY1